jgi:hypothetical protein
VKVHESSLSQAAAPQLDKLREAEAVKPGELKQGGVAQAGLDSDRVQLSELSGRLLESLKMESPERAVRLEKLGADYRAGRYQADALETSRRIIEDAIGQEQ